VANGNHQGAQGSVSRGNLQSLSKMRRGVPVGGNAEVEMEAMIQSSRVRDGGKDVAELQDKHS